MKKKDYEKILPVFPMGESVPRLIHQTYKTKQVEDPTLQDNIASLQSLNPNWSYMLYDDDDIKAFIIESYGIEVYHYYERISPRYGAARADFFRYLLLYKCGGVYLDIKSTIAQPLDDVLRAEDRYILSHWDNQPGERYADYGRFDELKDILPRGEYQQWFIISVAGHPFLRQVLQEVMARIDRYHPWLHDVGFFGVLKLTGPLPYTEAIYRCIQSGIVSASDYRMLMSNSELGLEYSVYDRSGELRGHRNVIALYNQIRSSIVQLGGKKCMKFLELGSLLIWVVRVLGDKIRHRIS